MSLVKPCVVLAALALAGCVNLGKTERPAATVYVLADAGAVAAAPAPARDPRTLLVLDTAADAYYDTDALAYARAPGTLARYQFARWSARPGKRYAQLLRARLDAAGRPAAGARAGGPVKGELLLDTRLVAFHHDAARAPGEAVVVLEAELVDLGERRLVERRRFEARVPAARFDAAAAAAAFDRATAASLDQLVAWLAASRAAAGQPPVR